MQGIQQLDSLVQTTTFQPHDLRLSIPVDKSVFIAHDQQQLAYVIRFMVAFQGRR